MWFYVIVEELEVANKTTTGHWEVGSTQLSMLGNNPCLWQKCVHVHTHTRRRTHIHTVVTGRQKPHSSSGKYLTP